MLRQSEALEGGAEGLAPWSKRLFVADRSIISLSSISRTFGPTTSVANRLTKEASQSRKFLPRNSATGSCYVSQTRPEGVRKEYTCISEHLLFFREGV